MSRKILTFDETYSIIAPYLEDYVDCIRKAFSDFKQINEYKNSLDVYSELAVRTKAGIIHDMTCARLLNKFGESPEINIGKWNQVFALKFSDLIFLRNKKFKNDGNISGYRTKQHKAFLNQSSIDGFPEKPTFIIGGYIPNSTYTELKGIYLGCWGSDGLEWFTKVGEYVVEQARIVFPEFAEVETKKRTQIKTVAKNTEEKKRTTVKNKINNSEDDKTGTENV